MAFTLHNVIDRRSTKVKTLLSNWEFNDNKLATILGVKYNEVAKMRKSAERSGSVTVEMKMSRLDAQIGKCKVIIQNKVEEAERYVEEENEDNQINQLLPAGGEVKPDEKMGYVSSVEDARKSLENIFKNNIDKPNNP